MARTLGSVGIVKREFEESFWQRCKQLKLKPGAYLAEMMHDARERGDNRTGLLTLALMTRSMADNPVPAQQNLPLVVVQRWVNPTEATGAIEYEAVDVGEDDSISATG